MHDDATHRSGSFLHAMVLVACVVGCTSRCSESSSTPVVAETVPPSVERWRETLFRDGDEPLANVPVITCKERRGADLFVRLKNVGTTTLVYSGYSRSDFQQFRESFDEGEWQTRGWDWCGTGMGSYRVSPGSSVLLRIERFDEIPGHTRVMASFREEGTNRQSLVVVATVDEVIE